MNHSVGFALILISGMMGLLGCAITPREFAQQSGQIHDEFTRQVTDQYSELVELIQEMESEHRLFKERSSGLFRQFLLAYPAKEQIPKTAEEFEKIQSGISHDFLELKELLQRMTTQVQLKITRSRNLLTQSADEIGCHQILGK